MLVLDVILEVSDVDVDVVLLGLAIHVDVLRPRCQDPCFVVFLELYPHLLLPFLKLLPPVLLHLLCLDIRVRFGLLGLDDWLHDVEVLELLFWL